MVFDSPQRLGAGPLDKPRCKLSIIASSVAQLSQVVPREVMQPYASNFHPSALASQQTIPLARRRGVPHVAAHFVPLARPVGSFVSQAASGFLPPLR